MLTIICALVFNSAYTDGRCQAPSSQSYVAQSWEALGKNDYQRLEQLAHECVERYGAQADQQQASLQAFASQDKIGLYQELNDVATCLFIRIEALVKQEKKEEAKEACRLVITKYPFAQAWDPRGWYWKIAEKAQATLNKLEGRNIETPSEAVSERITSIILYEPGTEDIVAYEKYGEFKDAGTDQYRYLIKNQEGLSAAVGEGIFPNTTSVRWDPRYVEAKAEHRLKGSHWDILRSPDLEAAFLRWAFFPEPKGVSMFYIGTLLERAGLCQHAVKAYYSILVHFPTSVGWTYWGTPWYVGQAAIAKIKYICRNNPQLRMKLVGAKISVQNGFDNDISNDIFVVNPGKIISNGLLEQTWLAKAESFWKKLTDRPKIRRIRGSGKVRLVQYENGDWKLMVDEKPFTIKGITYAPTKVSQSPDDGTLRSWMEYDYNNNGVCDGPFEAFVDKNRNNKQDPGEKTVGDFRLLKELGVTAIRLYHQPFAIQKDILRKLYKDYGIMVIMGDFLGKYAIGSGASWYEGTDYENLEHQKNMLASVKKMVLEFKDEPYILMWLLGNENVYGLACNANKKPEAFFRFCNEAAMLIKTIDSDHPVAIASGDVLFLDRFAQYCSEVDAFGTNAYRGGYGFGALWQQVKDLTDKPAFITEYGCPAFSVGKSQEEAEKEQADYLYGCWQDIAENMAGAVGQGNALGGIAFEYLDEWWKAYEPSFHDSKGLFTGPFPDGYMHEEWLGICGQGDGELSPFLRQPRKSYFMYKEVWKR